MDAYRIPTKSPEADGTFEWNATTLVLVEAIAENGQPGWGYSYAPPAAARLINDTFAPALAGMEVESVGVAWNRMLYLVRNMGRPGIASHAIAAVDMALWDLKARLNGLPLYQLLGSFRDAVPVYGSGGFTSYSVEQLCRQLSAWIDQGIPWVKMKIGKDGGTRPEEDLQRVRAVRERIGPQGEIFVDANGAYTVKQAIQQAEKFAPLGVTYFEEPVAFDQLEQLAFIRAHIPMNLASGEYGYDVFAFRNVLLAGAVDILQADATRCLGVTGCLQAAQLAYTFGVPFSFHTAPSVHAHLGCAIPQVEHIEFFFDHARIERMLFEHFLEPVDGCLRPDPERPGLGIEFKRREAGHWKIAY